MIREWLIWSVEGYRLLLFLFLFLFSSNCALSVWVAVAVFLSLFLCRWSLRWNDDDERDAVYARVTVIAGIAFNFIFIFIFFSLTSADKKNKLKNKKIKNKDRRKRQETSQVKSSQKWYRNRQETAVALSYSFFPPSIPAAIHFLWYSLSCRGISYSLSLPLSSPLKRKFGRTDNIYTYTTTPQKRSIYQKWLCVSWNVTWLRLIEVEAWSLSGHSLTNLCDHLEQSLIYLKVSPSTSQFNPGSFAIALQYNGTHSFCFWLLTID